MEADISFFANLHVKFPVSLFAQEKVLFLFEGPLKNSHLLFLSVSDDFMLEWRET